MRHRVLILLWWSCGQSTFLEVIFLPEGQSKNESWISFRSQRGFGNSLFSKAMGGFNFPEHQSIAFNGRQVGPVTSERWIKPERDRLLEHRAELPRPKDVTKAPFGGVQKRLRIFYFFAVLRLRS